MTEVPSSANRIVRGALQTVGSVYVARLANWTANIILMRQLSAEDFGLAATALAIITLISVLRRFGLHFALIHRYDRVEDLVPTHFFLNAGLGAISTIMAVAISKLFLEDHYAPVIVSAVVVYSVADFFRNAVMTAEVQLRRDLRFGIMAGAHAAATVVASIVAVGAAYSGFGVWALVVGFFVNNSVAYVVVYVLALWSHKPPPLSRIGEFDIAGARALLRYGVWFWLGASMQALILHYDRLVVGSFFGENSLGIYVQAHLFAQIPTGAVSHTLMGVTGAVYARFQNDKDRLSAAFRRTQRLIVRAIVPITVILAMEGPELVTLLVGERWVELVPVLRWLILYSLCKPIIEDINALLFGIGETRVTAQVSVVQGICILVAAPLLTQIWGVRGTALGMDVMAGLGLLLATRAASRHVDISWTKTLVPPLVAVATAVVIRVQLSTIIGDFSMVISVLVGTIVLSLVYVGILLLLERAVLLDDLRSFMDAYRHKSRPTGKGVFPG